MLLTLKRRKDPNDPSSPSVTLDEYSKERKEWEEKRSAGAKLFREHHDNYKRPRSPETWEWFDAGTSTRSDMEREEPYQPTVRQSRVLLEKMGQSLIHMGPGFSQQIKKLGDYHHDGKAVTYRQHNSDPWEVRDILSSAWSGSKFDICYDPRYHIHAMEMDRYESDRRKVLYQQLEGPPRPRMPAPPPRPYGRSGSAPGRVTSSPQEQPQQQP